MRFHIVTLAFAILTACGGGGAGSVTDRAASANALDAKLAGINVSNPQQLPTSGRAQYNGYMRANLPTEDNGARLNYLGDLTLDVNFGAARDEVAGQATGFTNGGGKRLDGSVAITGGDLYRDTDPAVNYTFTGDVGGRLTQGNRAFVIDAEIEGEFRGRDQDAVRGLLFGDVTGPDGQDIFDGTFAATRIVD